MQNPSFAWILIGIGVLLALLSAFAYPLGLGQNPDFGWKKSLGVVIGALIVVAGIYLRRRPVAPR
jgi:membrane associated rhomboid family serine protease